MNIARWLESFAPVISAAAGRGAVVMLLALALTHAMRRQSAAARHMVWVGAIVIQLLLPALALWGPRWSVEIPVSVASSIPVQLPQQVVPSVPAPVAFVAPALQVTAPDAPASEPSMTTVQFLAALWAIGALIVIGRLATGTVFVAVLARRGSRVNDSRWLSLMHATSDTLRITRPLTLLRGDKLGVPVTWGILRPVVLLPVDAESWPEERRRFVLVHELAHVSRLDAVTQLLGQITLALFWFDPLVWIANRRMQLEREHACDDCVIRHGAVPSLYAEELLSMVRSLGAGSDSTAQPAFAALAMARRSEIEGRMLSILDPVLDRHALGKGKAFAGALAALVLSVPLAALHPYQAPSAHSSSVVQPFTSSQIIATAPDTTSALRIDSSSRKTMLAVSPANDAVAKFADGFVTAVA